MYTHSYRLDLLLCLTMRCWKSQERMMLVACLGRTPLLFLDFLSSLSNRDDRSTFTFTVNTRMGRERKKRKGKKERMVGLSYCCHGNKGRLPITYLFFHWQGQKHLLKCHHGNWIWVMILKYKKAAPLTMWKHKRVSSVFGALMRALKSRGSGKPSVKSLDSTLWCWISEELV